jgi:hypothetical protein
LRVIKFWKCSEKYTIFKKNLVILGSPLIYINHRHQYACLNLS